MRTRRLFFGCLAVAVVLVGIPAFFVGVVWWGFHLEHLESERHKQEWWNKAFAEAKSGRADALIYDFELLPMLALDADCIANVTLITFTMVDLANPHIGETAKMVNVKEIVFYDCRNVSNALEALAGMESIESLYFETGHISDDDIRKLTRLPNLRKVHFEHVMDGRQCKLARDLLPKANVEVPNEED